ncbi:hypothetical protein D918_07573 [Trichuris suis]|nr:hypothetical protein D918_07573 [Trichuris suis]
MTSTSPINFLRYGVWASVTGGWLYDPRQSLFCNTVHMYLWLILFAAPVMISMFFTINVFLMTVYSAMVGMVFVVTKTIVWLLNYVFDKYEPSDELPMSSVVVIDDCNLKDGVPKENLSKRVSCSEQRGDSDFELREIPKDFSSADTSGERSHCISSGISSSKTVNTIGLHGEPFGTPYNDIAVEADVHDNPEDVMATDRLNMSGESSIVDENLLAFLHKHVDLPYLCNRRVCQCRRNSCGAHDDLRHRSSLLEIVRNNYTCSLPLENSSSCCKRNWRSSFPGATSGAEIFLKERYTSLTVPSWGVHDKVQDSRHSLSFPSKFRNLSKPVKSRRHQSSLVGMPVQWQGPFVGSIGSASTSSRVERVPFRNSVRRYTASCEARLASSDTSNEDHEFLQRTIPHMHSDNSDDLSTSGRIDWPSSDVVKEVTHSRAAVEFSQRSKDSECTGFSPLCTTRHTSDNGANRLFHGLRESLKLLKTYGGRSFSAQQEDFSSEELDLKFQLSSSCSHTSSFVGSNGVTVKTLKECDTPSGSQVNSPCSVIQPLKAFCQETNPFHCDDAAVSKECMIEEIKRLLEEIIESHPEALQAIESVRQAKLKTAGLMDLNKYPKDLLDSLIQDRLIGYHENNADSCQLSAVSATSSEVGEPLSNCLGGDSVTFDDSEERSRALLLSMMQTGKHMAASHDDTSEGAMHCFQDLEGNWWSYTFSSNGTGTAQSLGTGHELKSRLQRFRDAQPSGPSSSRRLTVYHQHSAGNGSTSSEESLLAGMPSSVFHPVASEVAGNPGRAHNVPTSRGRSLRLRLR